MWSECRLVVDGCGQKVNWKRMGVVRVIGGVWVWSESRLEEDGCGQSGNCWWMDLVRKLIGSGGVWSEC